jgi:hypothetical protein
MFRNVGIFRDNSDTVRYHLDHFKTLTPNDWAVYDDLGHYLNSGHPQNIAFIHLPYPFTPDTQSKLDAVCAFSDLVFVIGSELHASTLEFILKNDRTNIAYYLCGFVEQKLEHATVNQYFDWFETSRYFYKDYLPELLERIDYTTSKEAQFDILLGRKKLHRDLIYTYVKENLRVEDRVLTYFNEHQVDFATGNDQWIWEDRGMHFINDPKWTVVKYYGHAMSISQVIPIDIYNRTAYSIIAETNFDNRYSFYTEKTAKPIIAKRLFIMFAGQYYLRNLRALGFKTFDGIIDESYDSIENNTQRWEMACKQISLLCQLNQEEILQKIKPIVDHNFNIMMTLGWHSDFINSVESKIDYFLNSSTLAA